MLKIFLQEMIGWINKIFAYFVGLLILALVVISFASVVARFVFQSSLAWSDEFLRFTFIWMTFLGTAVLVVKKEHIGVDLVDVFFPKRIHHILYKLGYIVVTVFSAAVFYISLGFVQLNLTTYSPALLIPMGYVYLCMPISFLIITINFLKILIEEWLITDYANYEIEGMKNEDTGKI